jgi:hypothetical protein
MTTQACALTVRCEVDDEFYGGVRVRGRLCLCNMGIGDSV